MSPHPPGPRDSILDVAGVKVGHLSRVEPSEKGRGIRTGITAMVARSLASQTMPTDTSTTALQGQTLRPVAIELLGAAAEVTGLCFAEDFGSLMTPIVVTNLRAVGRAHDAMVGYRHPRLSGYPVELGWPPVVIGLNDSRLNNQRILPFSEEDVIRTIAEAREDSVAEGALGAGTGLVAFGYKSGVGSASRQINWDVETYTVGVLAFLGLGDQAALQIRGLPTRKTNRAMGGLPAPQGQGVVVLATDAPLDDRQLRELARAGLRGMASLGSIPGPGEGLISVSVSTGVLLTRYDRRTPQVPVPLGPDAMLGALASAAAEAAGEASIRGLTSVAAADGTPEYPAISEVQSQTIPQDRSPVPKQRPTVSRRKP